MNAANVQSEAVRLREVATRDIDEAISCYLRDSMESPELVHHCIRVGVRYVAADYGPGVAAPGHGTRRGPGTVSHLIFSVEGDGKVDVWRVLQGRRDIPAWLLPNNQ